MVRLLLLVWTGVALPLCGCVTDKPSTPLVPGDTMGNAQPIPNPSSARVSYSPASDQAALRVGSVGQRLVQANQQLGVRPVFRTVGSPQAEVFHRGTSEIVITEGLVRQCATEGQLAAVLSVELGKAISERETLAGPQTKQPEREPPIDLGLGKDHGGAQGPADQVRLAELAKFEKERRRFGNATATPPDPQALARTYLTRAGYAASEMAAAEPILRAASANFGLEKQLTSPTPSPSRPWVQ